MKKKIPLFFILPIILFSSFQNIRRLPILGSDYTFCYGNISVTLFDGGKAQQIRYGSDGKVLNTVSGEWTAYGSPTDMPGQTVKILYQGSNFEYSYELIRDGYGTPSVLADGQGRRYTLCKKATSKNDEVVVDKPKESSIRYWEDTTTYNYEKDQPKQNFPPPLAGTFSGHGYKLTIKKVSLDSGTLKITLHDENIIALFNNTWINKITFAFTHKRYTFSVKGILNAKNNVDSIELEVADNENWSSTRPPSNILKRVETIAKN